MLRILIADDNEDLAASLRDAFPADWAAVDVEHDGVAACRRILSASYDLIITDFRMPGMDGADVCAQLRASARNSLTRVVVLSGHLDDALVPRLVGFGNVTALAKPIEPERLLEIARDCLQRRRRFAAEPETAADAEHLRMVEAVRSVCARHVRGVSLAPSRSFAREWHEGACVVGVGVVFGTARVGELHLRADDRFVASTRPALAGAGDAPVDPIERADFVRELCAQALGEICLQFALAYPAERFDSGGVWSYAPNLYEPVAPARTRRVAFELVDGATGARVQGFVGMRAIRG